MDCVAVCFQDNESTGDDEDTRHAWGTGSRGGRATGRRSFDADMDLDADVDEVNLQSPTRHRRSLVEVDIPTSPHKRVAEILRYEEAFMKHASNGISSYVFLEPLVRGGYRSRCPEGGGGGVTVRGGMCSQRC